MGFRLDGSGVLRWEAWERYDWVAHGFTTRLSGDFAEPVGVAEPIGVSDMKLRSLRQVHSGLVYNADADFPNEGDGLVGSQPDSLLTVRVADCLPLLLLDPTRRVVGAVHSGWRGAAAGIASRAVAKMHKDFGCAPGELQALLGPCIGAERFEVGPEVAEQFPDEAVVDRKPRPHLNLEHAVRLQLRAAGVESIEGGGLCTYDREDWFYSYRRQGKAAGRMVAAIGIRSSLSTPG